MRVRARPQEIIELESLGSIPDSFLDVLESITYNSLICFNVQSFYGVVITYGSHSFGSLVEQTAFLATTVLRGRIIGGVSALRVLTLGFWCAFSSFFLFFWLEGCILG